MRRINVFMIEPIKPEDVNEEKLIKFPLIVFCPSGSRTRRRMASEHTGLPFSLRRCVLVKPVWGRTRRTRTHTNTKVKTEGGASANKEM